MPSLSTVERSLTEWGMKRRGQQVEKMLFREGEKSLFHPPWLYWSDTFLRALLMNLVLEQYETQPALCWKRPQIVELSVICFCQRVRSGHGASAAVCVRGATSGHPHWAPVRGAVRGASEGTNQREGRSRYTLNKQQRLGKAVLLLDLGDLCDLFG